jgi:hypothetical protein
VDRKIKLHFRGRTLLDSASDQGTDVNFHPKGDISKASAAPQRIVQPKAYFEAEPGAQQAPKVDFKK